MTSSVSWPKTVGAMLAFIALLASADGALEEVFDAQGNTVGTVDTSSVPEMPYRSYIEWGAAGGSRHYKDSGSSCTSDKRHWRFQYTLSSASSFTTTDKLKVWKWDCNSNPPSVDFAISSVSSSDVPTATELAPVITAATYGEVSGFGDTLLFKEVRKIDYLGNMQASGDGPFSVTTGTKKTVSYTDTLAVTKTNKWTESIKAKIKSASASAYFSFDTSKTRSATGRTTSAVVETAKDTPKNATCLIRETVVFNRSNLRTWTASALIPGMLWEHWHDGNSEKRVLLGSRSSSTPAFKTTLSGSTAESAGYFINTTTTQYTLAVDKDGNMDCDWDKPVGEPSIDSSPLPSS